MQNLSKQNILLLKSIISLIENARKNTAIKINSELTMLYWNIGKKINDGILEKKRADYGKKVLKNLHASTFLIFNTNYRENG